MGLDCTGWFFSVFTIVMFLNDRGAGPCRADKSDQTTAFMTNIFSSYFFVFTICQSVENTKYVWSFILFHFK